MTFPFKLLLDTPKISLHLILWEPQMQGKNYFRLPPEMSVDFQVPNIGAW